MVRLKISLLLLFPFDDKSKLNRMSLVTWLFKSGVHHYVLKWKFSNRRRTRGSDALQKNLCNHEWLSVNYCVKNWKNKELFHSSEVCAVPIVLSWFLSSLTKYFWDPTPKTPMEFGPKSEWIPNFGTIREFGHVLPRWSHSLPLPIQAH